MSEKLERVSVFLMEGLVVGGFIGGSSVEKANFCCPLLGLTKEVGGVFLLPGIVFGGIMIGGGVGVTNMA